MKFKNVSFMDIVHFFALSSAFLGGVFVLNNYITHIFGCPGLYGTLSLLGFNLLDKVPNYSSGAIFIGFIQSITYFLAIIYPIILILNKSYSRDEKLLNNIAEMIVSAAFWSVMLVGIVDAAISFVRIEDFLPLIVGDDLALSLGKPSFRGVYVHIPLIVIGTLIAFFRRGIDFIWLAALIVFGELLIVITRFIFSYEQAFMGDLVRFWYAALFLFSSAYTLIHDGHVRVDVIYASFSEKRKAITNIFGSLILGIPLCWVVLIRGLWNESSPFNLAILNFEVTQQGFGMYVKYLMSGFLIIFALSMLFQFSSFIISHINSLENKSQSKNSDKEMVSA